MITNVSQILYENTASALREIESKYSFHPDEVNYYNVHRPKSLILALQKRHTLFDPTIVAPLFLKYMKEKVTRYEVLSAAGTGHVITLVKTISGRELVLRTNMLLEHPEKYMEYEFGFIKTFTTLGIPTTPLYYADTSRTEYPFDFQIMGKLPGRDLGADWEGSQDAYEYICLEQGRYFAKLYQIPQTGWGRIRKESDGSLAGMRASLLDHLNAYLDHDLEVIGLFGVLSPDEVNSIETFFHSDELAKLFADTTPHLLHNDPSDLNMRYEGDKLVSVFDWEHAIMFDPISELGIAPTWKSAYPKREKLIEGFIQELGCTPEHLDAKMNVYFLRKMLDKVAFALKGERLSQRPLDLLKSALTETKSL